MSKRHNSVQETALRRQSLQIDERSISEKAAKHEQLSYGIREEEEEEEQDSNEEEQEYTSVKRKMSSSQAMNTVNSMAMAMNMNEAVSKPRRDKPGRSASVATIPSTNPTERSASTPNTTSAVGGERRVRISQVAVTAFEYVFAIEKKPNEALIRVLGQAFGESFARVKVWFQNRRGRESRDKVDKISGSGDESAGMALKEGQLPQAVLQTLLAQQRHTNPDLAADLAIASGSTDYATSTAQALNAMLTVNSISKFWGHHNHLLSGELICADGHKFSLSALKKDPWVKGNQVVMALLERVMELRQGVIDQFVMTDGMIKGSLPAAGGGEKSLGDTAAEGGKDKRSLSMAPVAATFQAAVPMIPESEMDWSNLGYTATPYYNFNQFPFADLNQQGALGHDIGLGHESVMGHGGPTTTNVHEWEFVNEDVSQFAESTYRPHFLPSPPATTPSPPPGSAVLDMFMEEVDGAVIPLAPWILEGLVKAVKSLPSSLSEGRGLDIVEAVSTARFAPADFHRLANFLSLYDEDSDVPAPPTIKLAEGVKVSVTPTIEHHAGWLMDGDHFAKVLAAPYNTIFQNIRFPPSGTSLKETRADLKQVYLTFSLRTHILQLRAVLTIS